VPILVPMYVPSIHKPDETEDVYQFIAQHGFATLIGNFDNKPIASHIPMYVDQKEDGTYSLLSHIAKANIQRHCLDGEQDLLAIFMESHAYISSSWYDHINVPTWNYGSVHVYGKASIITGEKLYLSINKLVEQYEQKRRDRFHLSDMPKDMQAAHFNGLVGFEMSMDRIESAHKLSQNRKDKDYHNIIGQLEKQTDQKSQQIAQKMKTLRS